MIKGVLFDIDGTLVDSNTAHAKAWQQAFREHGTEVELQKLEKLIGMGGDKLLAAVDPKLSDSEGLGKNITERRKEIFQETYLSTLQPTPGSRELVAGVQGIGLKTVVASSASESELAGLLKAANVQDLLTEATTSDDADKSKPAPDIVHVALKKLNLTPDEAVMIGDTPYDIEAAAKAGVQCIALLSGGWTEAELDGALAVYKDPADLLAHRADFGL